VSSPTPSSQEREAIRRQLEKVAAHPLFSRSERMARFLRLAVERTLDGKGDQLKEYLIGVEVFDRPPSYDPRVDPIVRVEARRLRAKLTSYYEREGRQDAVRFAFRPGSYAPEFQFAGEGSPGAAHGVAVLPFANLSANAEDSYFSDGLTEELIHALTKYSGMRVVAWNSATRLRGVEEDLGEVRRQVNVAHVLTGSVRIAGAKLRVRAQFIDTATGVYVWSETFDRPMEDVFAIQEEIAQAIVRTLHVRIAHGADSALAARTRTSVRAYEFYLKGRYHLHRRTPEEMRRALQYFEAAVAADPQSAVALSGVADAYTLIGDYGLLPPSEALSKAKAAATAALALDPELAEAYPSLATIRATYDWEWAEGEALYRRGMALNPGYATAHHWYASDWLALMGRFDEALTELDFALDLDPLSSIIQENRALTYLMKRDYEEALRCCRKVLEFDPSFYKGYTCMGRAYALMGDYSEALRMLGKGRAIAGDMSNILAATGEILARSGQTEAARTALADLHQRAAGQYVPYTCFAIVHLGLGERDESLTWLERAVEQRALPLVATNAHPIYDDLRGEPRFEAVLRRMRFR
jgi:TolB-like protein/Tfp pilus assembly protein PilF